MITNILLYTIILSFIISSATVLWKKYSRITINYFWFLILLIPSFILVFTGVYCGALLLPKFKIAIHGYKIPLTETNSITIGSDNNDSLQFHHFLKKKEQIDPRLLIINFKQNQKGNNLEISQRDIRSKNVVEINGIPIRSYKIAPDMAHYITFKKFNYNPNNALKLTIINNKPVFQYKNRIFTKGFFYEFFFGLCSWPLGSGGKIEVKHLGWNSRIDVPELKDALKQSALYWKNGDIWLAANDAEIKLDGKTFPNTNVITSGKCVLKIYSHQIGNGRWSIALNLHTDKTNNQVFFELDQKSKKFYPLNEKSSEHIVLTGKSIPFKDSLDIIDDQFPKSGYVIKKEGNRFIFRGGQIQFDTLYSCGKAVFSIDVIGPLKLIDAALYCCLFLISVLFYPSHTIRKEPVIGLIIASSIFLLSFRQILSFCAWQNPPFNARVFYDSAISPAIFIFSVIIVAELDSIVQLFKFISKKLWNKLFLSSKKTIEKLTLDLTQLPYYFYGIILFFLFYKSEDQGILLFIILIPLLMILINLVLNGLEKFDRIWIDSLSSDIKYIITILVVIFPLLIFIARAFGGREVINIFPIRIRPDIFTQILLVYLVSFLAEYLRRKSKKRPIRLLFIFSLYSYPFCVCLFQGIISKDFGFIICVWPPLLFLLFLASWNKEKRLLPLLTVLGISLFLGFYIIMTQYSFIDNRAFNRILFSFDPERLKAEYFFDYLAQIPVLWSCSQGIMGGGFFNGLIDPSLYSTCINDHVASVFIQGELGCIGTILILFIYIILCCSPLLFLMQREALNMKIAGARFRIWIIFGFSITILWTAIYMFAANLGLMPLTGKNLPLLGLDSKNDVIQYGLIIGLMIRYIKQLKWEKSNA